VVDLAGLRALVLAQPYRPLFATVSGAHLYGFPSPDSDVDVRGAHLLALEDVVGLERAQETLELELDHRGQEVELVSHDLAKYLRMLVKQNGYVLEQILSPIVVLGEEFLARLRPVARGCIHRRLYHHYRGFLGTQLGLLRREEPKKVKSLLYAYRVAMTGIHVLRTGEVEANIVRLNETFRLEFIPELIAAKQAGERAPALDLDWARHEARLLDLERELDAAFEKSSLPEKPDRAAAHRLLVEERLRSIGGLAEGRP
jgi:uncharacterized protein